MAKVQVKRLSLAEVGAALLAEQEAAEKAINHDDLETLRRYFDAIQARIKHRMKELKMKGKGG